MQHPSDIESLFRDPLDQIQVNTVSFALQHSYTQMEHAVFYRVAELPRELSEWVRRTNDTRVLKTHVPTPPTNRAPCLEKFLSLPQHCGQTRLRRLPQKQVYVLISS